MKIKYIEQFNGEYGCSAKIVFDFVDEKEQQKIIKQIKNTIWR